MWTLKTAVVKPLTSSLARYFSEMERAPNDRKLSDRRLSVYKNQLAQGWWRPCTWAEAVCEETGITYRVNGKHTSTLFASMEAVPNGLFVTIETYACATLADVARLYGTYDRSIQARTSSDINRMFAATEPALAEVSNRMIDACAAGLQLYRSGGVVSTAQMVDPATRAEGLLDECVFVVWASQIVGDTTKHRHLVRSGVVAAMYATYRKSQRDALSFWQSVRDETGAKPSMPDRQLSRWLLLTSVHAAASGTLPASRRADSREFYVRSLHMWNAWRRDQQVKMLKYYVAEKVPAVA